MHNEFTAVIERDGDWFIAYSDRRSDGMRAVPADAFRETVIVE